MRPPLQAEVPGDMYPSRQPMPLMPIPYYFLPTTPQTIQQFGAFSWMDPSFYPTHLNYISQYFTPYTTLPQQTQKSTVPGFFNTYQQRTSRMPTPHSFVQSMTPTLTTPSFVSPYRQSTSRLSTSQRLCPSTRTSAELAQPLHESNNMETSRLLPPQQSTSVDTFHLDIATP